MTMQRSFLAALGVTALALSACQSGGGGGSSGSVDFSNEAYGLSVKLADSIGRCWFGPGETTFAGYVYTPERNAGVSRILVVKKDNPTGLPALVVQATSATAATIYGPLADSASGARIRGDVDRWAKGGTTCT
jgi:hypothetical protein